MFFFVLLKKWRFWVYEVDWRICVIRWKSLLHIFLRTKRFGVNDVTWNDFDSIMGYSHKQKVKLYFIYLFNYQKCLNLVYSPFAGFTFRLKMLMGYSFETPDHLKYWQHGNKFIWIGKIQMAVINDLKKLSY